MREQFLPPDILNLSQRIAEAEPLPGKRVLLIGDREPRNFESLGDYANHNSDLQPAGLIVPGGDIDRDILPIVDRFKDMLSSGTADPLEEENGALGYHFLSADGVDFSYEHAPYESARLKEEEYRRQYCLRLVDMARRARPDIIFLSNFKVILHPVFVEAFEGKIVNVHPSVLPLLKGFRPEYRADQGEEPDATGYTMHLVDTDLDGGPTLFQQYVPLEPRNLEEEEKMGKKEYDKKREEAHRLKIIQAQARWSPQVLALVASDTPRKIVSGDEAFIAEGRPSFAQSEEYQRLLEKEYEEWEAKSRSSDIRFEDWKKGHKPYSRVLFDKGNGWQTAEAIIGAPRESDERGPDIITQYSFKIPAEDRQFALERFKLLMRLANKIRGERGMDGGIKTGYEERLLENPPYSIAHIELPYDMGREFEELMAENPNMKGVELEIETKPTRVGARRKSFWPGNGVDE